MQLLDATIAAQLDLIGSMIGVVVAVILSFIAITLISSYYRFQHVVEMAERTNPEDMGTDAEEILRVQLARYLAGCARRGTSFSLSLIQRGDVEDAVRIDSPFVGAIKAAARRDDITCIYDGRTAVLLTEMEPEDSVTVLNRISGEVCRLCPEVDAAQLKIGISSYPGHGLSGKLLLDVAKNGLEQATSEDPIVLPEIIDVDAEEEEIVDAAEPEAIDVSPDQDSAGKWSDRRKNSMLDPLTGVLKPTAVSAYMQRMLSELRRKKKKIALFCIGVNNMEHIARFHGEATADEVLAGVSKVFQDNLRADDLIGRHEKYAFLVLAECSLEEAEIIGRRITLKVQQTQFESGNKKLKTSITLGVATYPDHGRNLHHLYTAGQKVLDYSRANDIRAYAVYDPEIHDKVLSKPMKSIKSVKA